MSGNLTDLMTPEQARMMYAALRERLPQGADQPIDVTAPLEFLSVSARQPNAPVTQGIAATAQPPADADLPVPPPQMAPPPAARPGPATPAEAAAAPSPTMPQGEADALARLRELVGNQEGRPSQGELARDALSNFFFSMAASRNPSFFGQLGEAGQTFSTAARQARQDARQERQVDVEAAYRAASEARQAAEADWARDPRNPLNIARLAAARSDEVRARAALASAGRERLGQGVQIERQGQDGQTQYGVAYPGASGGYEERWFPGNVRPSRTGAERLQLTALRAIQQEGDRAERAYRDSFRNSPSPPNPEEIRRGAAQEAATARRRAAIEYGIDPEVAERFGSTAAPTEGGNRVRLPGL